MTPRRFGKGILTFLLVLLVITLLSMSPKDDPRVGAAGLTPPAQGVDEVAQITCRSDGRLCQVDRLDTLGNYSEESYPTLHDALGWVERVSQEFVEQVTVYLVP